MLRSKVFILAFALLAFQSTEGAESEQIEKIMEIFYLKPEMRSAYDTVKVEAGQAKISIWRDLPPNPLPDKVECLGYEWLLTGRGQHIGKGVRKVFEQLPSIQSVELSLVELSFKTKSGDGKGKIEKQTEAKTYLKLKVDRAKVLSSAPLEKMEVFQDLQKCLGLGRQMVSQREINL